ncbi:unnamed protein product [Strongylus vulgaris]|uniref:Uncharacterized protein n=1 Tax=Strongylus vulgaris TaxID=40348 RepID=A0A3P7KGY0_STRVU|nr:unnamed protein product [Strongylus vulgaris]
MIPAVIAERTFASRYINDYESKSRPWVSYLVNGSSFLLASMYFWSQQFGLHLVPYIIIVSIIVFMLSSVAIIVVHRRDVFKLRDLSKQGSQSSLVYTLSTKFQLAENVRVTKWLKFAIIGVSVWGFGACLLSGIAYVVIGEDKPVSQVIYAAFNTYVAISLSIVIWLSLAAIGVLRRLLRRLSKYICSTNRVTANELYQTAHHDPQTATEKYFNHLQAAWAK